MKTRSDLVIAIHPKHAEAIILGEKKHELRTRFPAVPRGTRVYLYATAPVSAIVGGFLVGDVLESSPDEIWRHLGTSVGLSSEEFRRYLGDRSSAKAIQVRAPFRLYQQVSRRELKVIAREYNPPQSSGFLRESALDRHLSLLTPTTA